MSQKCVAFFPHTELVFIAFAFAYAIHVQTYLNLEVRLSIAILNAHLWTKKQLDCLVRRCFALNKECGKISSVQNELMKQMITKKQNKNE